MVWISLVFVADQLIVELHYIITHWNKIFKKEICII